MSFKWIVSGIAALGLAAAANPPQAVVGQAQAGGAKGGNLEFESGEKGLEVSDLVEQAKSITGEEFFFDPRDLRDTRVCFAGKIGVPREKFLSFFDFCLHETGFIETERMVAGAKTHSIAKFGNQGGGSGRATQALKSGARIVERAELDAMSDRFTLVTTTYLCKNLPAREAVTTLQLYFADSATEAIRNIEGSDAIVMTGFAPNLAATCTMLDRIDAQVGKSEAFQHGMDYAKRIAALEAQVAALSKLVKAANAVDEGGKK